MGKIKDYVQDNYSWFNFKSRFETVKSTLAPNPGGVAGWVPPEEVRRLNGYALLDAYYNNNAREWLNEAMPDEDRQDRREYGDPHLIVETALSSLLGEDQILDVKGAEASPDSVSPENADVDAETAFQRIKEWMTVERFVMKMMETERNAVKLADGVYVLGNDVKAGRPRLSVYDPACYFPDLERMHLTNSNFPDTVCIAYAFTQKNPEGQAIDYVRRIKWTLVTLDTPINYPWNVKEIVTVNDDETTTIKIEQVPSDKTVIMSDGIWRINDVKDVPSDFAESAVAEWLMVPTDIEIDFIPVVHIPNTVSESQHYGVSVLAPVLQVFDDLTAVDTDIQGASSTTGAPPIVINGTMGDDTVLTYGPGTVIKAGEGNATILDTSKSLVALLSNKDSLQERLSVNSRTPESLLGRVKPNEVPSGITLKLSFAPHSAFVKEMRLVRQDKYPILFKFIQRFMVLNGDLDKVRPATIRFGTFLPADQQEIAVMVQTLLTSHAISIETACRMLLEAGFPIDSVTAEVLRINANDFAKAQAIFDLTGNVAYALEAIGRDDAPEPDPLPDDPNADPNQPPV